MTITITENGQDLLLTNTKTNQHTYLHNPTWEELLGALRGALRNFVSVAEAENELGPAAGPIVGQYEYVRQFQEHEFVLYPGRATPNGWIAAHLGTRYAYYVIVHENGHGTVTMTRDDLELWTATDRPRPRAFFEELEALSGPENPSVEWSSDDPPVGEIVAVVYDEDNEIRVSLYPDSWGRGMWVYVIGSSPW